jgi:hypothetical protein
MSNSPEHLLIVQAQVEPPVEQAWNAWYDTVHLPEILDCPGFVSGTRYVSDTAEGRVYLAIYALASGDALASDEFASRRGWADFKPHVTASVLVYRKVAEGSKADA